MRQLISHNAWRLQIHRDALNRERLLAALCRQESTGWKDRRPNFEPAFYLGGRFGKTEIISRWQTGVEAELRESIGKLAASSFGPWQLMYPVAVELGFDGHPFELADPLTNCLFAIRYINERCLAKGLKDLAAGGDEDADGDVDELDRVAQIADAFNSGTHLDRWKPHTYMDEVVRFYQDPYLMEDLAILPAWYPRSARDPQLAAEPAGQEGARG